MGGECVVDGDGNAAGGQGPTLDQLADVSLKWKVAPLVLCHMDPIHPLQTHRVYGAGAAGQSMRGTAISCIPSHRCPASCHLPHWPDGRNGTPEEIRQPSPTQGTNPSVGQNIPPLIHLRRQAVR